MQNSKKRCSYGLAELVHKAQNLGIVHITESDISTIPIYTEGVLKYYHCQKEGYYAYRLESIKQVLQEQWDVEIEESFENVLGFKDKLYRFRNKYTATVFSPNYTEGLDRTLTQIIMKLTSEST